MRTVGIGVSDAVNHGNLALVPQGLYRPHVGVEAEVIVNGQDLVRRDADRGAVVIVEGVAIRDHCVERIIRSNQLEHHQSSLLPVRWHRSPSY